MKYSKPVIVAQNASQGIFSAGCPLVTNEFGCKPCESNFPG